MWVSVLEYSIRVIVSVSADVRGYENEYTQRILIDTNQFEPLACSISCQLSDAISTNHVARFIAEGKYYWFESTWKECSLLVATQMCVAVLIELKTGKIVLTEEWRMQLLLRITTMSWEPETDRPSHNASSYLANRCWHGILQHGDQFIEFYPVECTPCSGYERHFRVHVDESRVPWIRAHHPL